MAKKQHAKQPKMSRLPKPTKGDLLHYSIAILVAVIIILVLLRN